ncbi:hypothetical protein Plec18170_005649 [Paecilomyces lecythidis]
MTTTIPTHQPQQPAKRLLIFQETKDVTNKNESIFQPVNAAGLPISGSGPQMPSMLDLPLRLLKALTELLNHNKFKGWALLGAAPYHDVSEEGKFFAVILEQIRDPVSEKK